MVCSLDEKESIRTNFCFLLFLFILVNQVVGLCWSIADLGSHLHKEVKTQQWPWAAATASYCSRDSNWETWSETRPALYLSVIRKHIISGDRHIGELSFAIILCNSFWKGVPCGKPKEDAIMRSQRGYANETQAILEHLMPLLHFYFVILTSIEKEKFSFVRLAVALKPMFAWNLIKFRWKERNQN